MKPNTDAALSDADLREMLDLLSQVVASMSERIDAQTAFQTRATDTLLKAADATFTAAVATKKQTDPARFAEELGNKIDAPIWKIIDAFTALHDKQAADIKSAKKTAEDLLDAQHDTHEKIHRWAVENTARKRHSLFIALSALVIALGFSIALPRFLVGTGWGCNVMGGAWSSASGSDGVCIFYAR